MTEPAAPRRTAAALALITLGIGGIAVFGITAIGWDFRFPLAGLWPLTLLLLFGAIVGTALAIYGTVLLRRAPTGERSPGTAVILLAVVATGVTLVAVLAPLDAGRSEAWIEIAPRVGSIAGALLGVAAVVLALSRIGRLQGRDRLQGVLALVMGLIALGVSLRIALVALTPSY